MVDARNLGDGRMKGYCLVGRVSVLEDEKYWGRIVMMIS